jgi:hypothetical protein
MPIAHVNLYRDVLIAVEHSLFFIGDVVLKAETERNHIAGTRDAIGIFEILACIRCLGDILRDASFGALGHGFDICATVIRQQAAECASSATVSTMT